MSSCYIVDKDYRVLYFDEGTKRRFPEIQTGDICYEVFNKTKEPCEGCRCCMGSQKMRYYNRNIHMEVEAGFHALPDMEESGNYLVIVEEKGTPDQMFRDLYEPGDGVEELDLLTGLHRRRTFGARVMELLKNRPGEKWVMAAMDIEHFKMFNAWHGEAAGDLLLKQIGVYLKRLKQQEVRGCETGYFGGDDFYAVLPEDEALIQKIQKDISALIADFGTQSGFFLRMGVYRIHENITFRAMCDKAQIAVSKTKENVHRRIVWFDDSMMMRLEWQQKILAEVQHGLQHREFVVYAQPKCGLRTGKIVGAEALVRWKHPEKGIVPPGEYLPYLEEIGLISDLDLYVWEEVCRIIRHSIDHSDPARLPVSVNVSVADLHTVDVPEVFRQLTEKYRIPHKYLEIEITESAYAEEFEVVNKSVCRLKQMGFTVLMDDFGSGYSSLNMLKDIQVDILKIDMKFLELQGENKERGINILQSIIRLAELMKLRVIAEGVETREQVELLLEMGCPYGQGYYFYHPMPAEELRKLLLEKDKADVRGICIRNK